MNFCHIVYVFLSTFIKFYGENVEKKCTGLCEFREHRRSEYSYFTTSVDKFPSHFAHLLTDFREIRYNEFECIALENL